MKKKRMKARKKDFVEQGLRMSLNRGSIKKELFKIYHLSYLGHIYSDCQCIVYKYNKDNYVHKNEAHMRSNGRTNTAIYLI